MAVMATIAAIGNIAEAVGVTAEKIGNAAEKIEDAAEKVYDVLDNEIGVTVQIANVTPWELTYYYGGFKHGGWAADSNLGFDVFPAVTIPPGQMAGCVAADKGLWTGVEGWLWYTGPAANDNGLFAMLLEFDNPAVGGNSVRARAGEIAPEGTPHTDALGTVAPGPAGIDSATVDVVAFVSNGNKCRAQFVVTPDANLVAKAVAALSSEEDTDETQLPSGIQQAGPGSPSIQSRTVRADSRSGRTSGHWFRNRPRPRP